MIGVDCSRAGILVLCGFLMGFLFNPFIFIDHGVKNVFRPPIKPTEELVLKPEPKTTTITTDTTEKPVVQNENAIEIEFEDFLETKEKMSHLNGSYLSAKEFSKDTSMKVPRILHFLWIYQPIPDKYLEAITEFEKNNPDYQIFFWTDNASFSKVQDRSSWTIKDVNSLNLTIPEVIEGENEKEAGWGWIGAKTDLLSYEIVYQYGGIYLDTDSRSVKPFGPIFQESFVCYDYGWNTLVHSVFGMPVGSKFLHFVLESARLNFQQEEFRKRIVYLRYGPTFLGKMFFKFNDTRINIIDSSYLIFNHTNTNYMIQTNDQSWGGRK